MSRNDERVAIHNIISLHPVDQSQRRQVEKLLADNLSNCCSRSTDTEIKKLVLSQFIYQLRSSGKVT